MRSYKPLVYTLNSVYIPIPLKRLEIDIPAKLKSKAYCCMLLLC